MQNTDRFSIDDLSRLTGLTVRTIRFYIQMGLVDRPEGQKRASFYTPVHLEQLLRVKRLVAEGRSLESIRALMQDDDEKVMPSAPVSGEITVCSHVHLAEGIELVIDPERAGLDPRQLRTLIRETLDLLDEIKTPAAPQDINAREE